MSRLNTLLKGEKTAGCLNSTYKEWFFVPASQCIRTGVCENCPAHFEVGAIADLTKLIEE